MVELQGNLIEFRDSRYRIDKTAKKSVGRVTGFRAKGIYVGKVLESWMMMRVKNTVTALLVSMFRIGALLVHLYRVDNIKILADIFYICL